MRVVLLGRTGSGKGVQARALAAHFDVPAVSCGDLFRAAAARGSADCARSLREGRLSSDEDVWRLLEPSLREALAAGGFVIEGFPRRATQVAMLDAAIGEGGLTCAVHVDVAPRIAVERLGTRTACPRCQATYRGDDVPRGVPCRACGTPVARRADDEPAPIAAKMAEFETVTAPVVRAYAARGVLRTVDGAADVGEVFARIVAAIADRSGAGKEREP